MSGLRQHRALLTILALLAVVGFGFFRVEQLVRSKDAALSRIVVLESNARKARKRGDVAACQAGNDVRGVVEQLVLSSIGLPILVARLAPTQLDKTRLMTFDLLLRASLLELVPVDCQMLAEGHA